VVGEVREDGGREILGEAQDGVITPNMEELLRACFDMFAFSPVNSINWKFSCIERDSIKHNQN